MMNKRRFCQSPRSLHRQRGISMIEVMIALFVLAIGLLATAQLQSLSLQRNSESLFRTQATNLGYEILDQLRASRRVVVDRTPSTDQIDRFEELVADRLPGGGVTVVVNGDLITITMTWIDDRTQAAAAQTGDPDDRETSFVFTSRI